jgi:hypothetical protein
MEQGAEAGDAAAKASGQGTSRDRNVEAGEGRLGSFVFVFAYDLLLIFFP